MLRHGAQRHETNVADSFVLANYFGGKRTVDRLWKRGASGAEL